MPTKNCLVCDSAHPHDAETCGSCGEASWSEYAPDPAPTPPAVDDGGLCVAGDDAAVPSPDPAPTAPASPQGKRARR